MKYDGLNITKLKMHTLKTERKNVKLNLLQTCDARSMFSLFIKANSSNYLLAITSIKSTSVWNTKNSQHQKPKLQGIGLVLASATKSWPYKTKTEKITRRDDQILKIILLFTYSAFWVPPKWVKSSSRKKERKLLQGQRLVQAAMTKFWP